MGLSVDVTHTVGRLAMRVAFETDGGLVGLFGRSGAGKTTLINMIAGLVQPDAGRIVCNGTILFDRAQGIGLPPHRRGIGYVFQDARLFPHLSVRSNLRYGRLWHRLLGQRGGGGTAEIGEDRVIDLLGLDALLHRNPRDLSGGEKQRVAIGRALLAAPSLLLMDEPLASLDEARKADIIPFIERLRDELDLPILYVSHDLGEVARLADTLILLSDGQVAAAGPTGALLGRVDLFPLLGRAEAGALLTGHIAAHHPMDGLSEIFLGRQSLLVPQLAQAVGQAVRVRIRARDVMLSLEPPGRISALNCLAGTVTALGPVGDHVLDAQLSIDGQPLLVRVTRRSLAQLDLTIGRPVYAVIKTSAVDRRMISRMRADR